MLKNLRKAKITSLPGVKRLAQAGEKIDLATAGFWTAAVLTGIAALLGVLYVSAGLFDALLPIRDVLPSELFGVALLLLLTATMVILLLMIHRALHKLLQQPSPPPIRPPQPPSPPPAVDQQIRQLKERLDDLTTRLDEIAENTLLDEAGRQAKRRRLAQQEQQRAHQQARQLIDQRQWAPARRVLEQLDARYPGLPETARMREELETKRIEAMEQDCAAAEKTIHDLMAICAWDRAEKRAAELLETHPDSDKAAELLEHVRQQRRRFEREQIQKKLSQIRRCTNEKRWIEALKAAESLITEHPASAEAQSLRPQLETLRTNAEIEHRQHLEQRFTELVKQRRFIEALDLARHVIQRYPTSPQAEALIGQLDRLEEKARRQRNALHRHNQPEDTTILTESDEI